MAVMKSVRVFIGAAAIKCNIWLKLPASLEYDEDKGYIYAILRLSLGRLELVKWIKRLQLILWVLSSSPARKTLFTLMAQGIPWC